MRLINSRNVFIKGLIRDSFIGLLLFILVSFIDLELAFFVFIISIYMFLTRRIILNLNPGAINRHKIYFKGRELPVPIGVDVFNAGNVSSLENLHSYVEVICKTLIPPRIIIIRINNKSIISRFEIEILDLIIKRLKKHEISIIFSDVNANMQYQLRENGVAEQIGDENVFYYIQDALKRANEVLNQNQLPTKHY